ncbi:MAG: hypothetical protein AABN95_03355 [Acidobacteriota bacterium]
MYNDKKRHTLFLLGLNKLASGNPQQSVETTALSKEIGMVEPEIALVANYLKAEKLIEFRNFNFVNITHQGTIEADRIMTERFEEKERRVLQKHYDERDRHPRGIHPDELAAALDMELRDVQEIILELDNKKWIGGSDEVSWILPAGIKEIEKLPEQPAQNIVQFYGPNTGSVQIGSHQTQNISYNQPISEILPKLAELIAAVRQRDFEDKDEVVADLERVQSLAQGEINEGTLKRIQTKLTAAKTTMEIVGLAYQSLPYWPLIWGFFHK